MNDDKNTVGVIVGRFQVHKLHEGHRQVIDNVISQHKRVLIFLGVSPVPGTKKNPLDFFTRALMINESYPDITVLPIHDHPNDVTWSHNLDSRISEIVKNGQPVLYGSRDSFLGSYYGQFAVKELKQTIFYSGTEVRAELQNDTRKGENFRAGAIYTAFQRYDTAYPTVDAAILKYKNNDQGEIESIYMLLAKKTTSDLYRFVGGFIDPTDKSAEDALLREVKEETTITDAKDVTYLGSFKINDWRYRGADDGIMTFLYAFFTLDHNVVPGDDISDLRWFNVGEGEISNDMIEPEHQQLFKSTIEYIKKLKTIKFLWKDYGIMP